MEADRTARCGAGGESIEALADRVVNGIGGLIEMAVTRVSRVWQVTDYEPGSAGARARARPGRRWRCIAVLCRSRTEDAYTDKGQDRLRWPCC